MKGFPFQTIYQPSPVFRRSVPKSNGDNWLLTRNFAFVDLPFLRLLALASTVSACLFYPSGAEDNPLQQAQAALCLS
jgi:hypothetical protein